MILASNYRPRIHCSIDVLFHQGALPITRAVGVTRAVKAGEPRPQPQVSFNVKTEAVDATAATEATE